MYKEKWKNYYFESKPNEIPKNPKENTLKMLIIRKNRPFCLGRL